MTSSQLKRPRAKELTPREMEEQPELEEPNRRERRKEKKRPKRTSPILLQDRKSIATLSPSGIGSQDFEQKNSPLERWRSSRG